MRVEAMGGSSQLPDAPHVLTKKPIRDLRFGLTFSFVYVNGNQADASLLGAGGGIDGIIQFMQNVQDRAVANFIGLRWVQVACVSV